MFFEKIKEEKYQLIECNMSNNEFHNLVKYGFEKIPYEKFEQLMIEWAVNDILKKKIEELKSINKGLLNVKRKIKKSNSNGRART